MVRISNETTSARCWAVGLASLLTLLFAATAFAGTDTQTLTISATVGPVSDVQLIDDSGTGNAETLSYIGLVRILDNDPDGFTMTISSDESGVLRRGATADTIPYAVYLIEESGALGPPAPANFPLNEVNEVQLTTPVVSNFGMASAPSTDVTYSVNLSLGSFLDANAGDYTDTITFDLADL